ncbi:MAG: DUF2069 domain-containing protein [Burkholderiales bacterium]|nr:DUF2069 domain-containing protein [Burkholderiales bacterium]
MARTIAVVALTHFVAVVSLVALLFLCLAWEAFLAPLQPGGSWLMLKALPLLLPLFGLLRERVYTYQWTTLLVLAYFTEGVVRAWAETGTSQRLAALEVLLSVTLFVSCIAYVRARRSVPSMP